MNDSPYSANTVRNTYRGRLILLVSLFSLVVLLYIGYIFRLQIIQGGEYRSRARQVSRRIMPLNAQRGEIFDRQYDSPIVVNMDSFAVDIIPAELSKESLRKSAENLAPLLSLSTEEIIAKVPDDFASFHQPVELQDGVDYRSISYIAEHIEDYPGITWHSKPIRQYLNIGSLSHVVGYVGNITSEELQVLYNEGYELNSVVGKSGIEKRYDDVLRGVNGKRYYTVDVHGRMMEGETIEEVQPINGSSLVLTIDMEIQTLAEKALGERMGSAVVMKPASGEILAMVSYPWYDPNIFHTADAKEKFRELSLDTNNPVLNRAIQSSYAPASTFKVVMSTAALAEEAISPDRKIYCDGSLRVGNRVFKCHVPEGHGYVDLPHALAESCDVYYYTLGLNYLGVETISRYARAFGFGEYTGIDLPGEIGGLVPNPDWKEDALNSPWVGGDTVNMSIGQGFLSVTPIQMANMVAMTINGGTVYKPHVLKELRDPVTGAVTKTIEPEVLRSSTVRDDVFEVVQDYMRGVVEHGTAEVVITTEAVEVAGKTGTGEVGYEDRWDAWFAAGGPYGAAPEDQIVVVTMVEASNEWEWWAVRAANIIFQGIFADETYDEALESLNWGWLKNDRRP